MINNRQAGRRRGRGGQQQRPQGGSGRPDNGNRIDNRARGNAAQMLEKYKTLARDAQMQGDRVNVEYYLQFADHYFRVLAETRARFEETGQSTANMRRPTGATLDEDEPDFEDEGGPADLPRGNEQQRSDGNGYARDRQQGDGNRNDAYRGDGNRNDGNRADNNRSQDQDDRPRRANGNGSYNGNGNENGYDRQPREDRGPREDRPREQQSRDGQQRPAPYRDQQPVREPQPQRDAQPRRDDRYERPAVAAPTNGSIPEQAPEQAEIVAEAPRRGRGRPRREVVVEEAPAFDAGILPPALGPIITADAGADTDGGDEAAEKPRRRRGRPPANPAPVE